MYDMIIIGGGPAGITAAAMVINQRLETLIIAERWGGQTGGGPLGPPPIWPTRRIGCTCWPLSRCRTHLC